MEKVTTKLGNIKNRVISIWYLITAKEYVLISERGNDDERIDCEVFNPDNMIDLVQDALKKMKSDRRSHVW